MGSSFLLLPYDIFYYIPQVTFPYRTPMGLKVTFSTITCQADSQKYITCQGDSQKYITCQGDSQTNITCAAEGVRTVRFQFLTSILF